MPRLKTIVNLPLQKSIEKEIKERFGGAFISRNELRQYLKIGKCRHDIFDDIPKYHITPGRESYRAVDVAAWLAAKSVDAGRLY